MRVFVALLGALNASSCRDVNPGTLFDFLQRVTKPLLWLKTSILLVYPVNLTFETCSLEIPLYTIEMN